MAETEHAWLDAIEGKTIREIEDVVAGAASGDLPDDPRDPDLAPRRWGVDHRCRVPGCRGSKWLEIHHIVPRAAGGTHEPDRLLTLCSNAPTARPTATTSSRRRSPRCATSAGKPSSPTPPSSGCVPTWAQRSRSRPSSPRHFARRVGQV